MNIYIFLILIMLVLLIAICVIFKKDTMAGAVMFVFITSIIGALINNNIKPIDYDDICERVQVIALSVDNNDELKYEIKKIIDEQVTEDGYSKLKIEIEDEDVTGGEIKTVNISAKEKIIGEFVCRKSSKKFKMAISDVEGKNVKVIDFSAY